MGIGLFAWGVLLSTGTKDLGSRMTPWGSDHRTCQKRLSKLTSDNPKFVLKGPCYLVAQLLFYGIMWAL